MNSSIDRIGFIGLGLMGLPMAKNLLQADIGALFVYNRTPSKASELGDAGATLATSPKDMASELQGGVIIICVSDTPAMMSVVHTLAEADLSRTLVIDMGTTTVAATLEAAKLVQNQGGQFVDAPVSGGAVGAQTGTLSIMAGGDVADIERARPLFEALGKSLTHIGPVGSGQVAKAANQAIVGATVSIVAEAMMLTERSGADPGKMREALLGGFAQSRILDLHGQRMIDRQFEPGGRAETQLKDLNQVVELADSLGLSLPMIETTRNLWYEMVEKGHGALDQSGYYVAVLESNVT